MFLRTQTKHFISWPTKDKCFTDTKQALTWKIASLQQKQDNVRCWAVKVDKFYFGLLSYARYARAALYLQLYVIVNNRRFPGSTGEVILSYPPAFRRFVFRLLSLRSCNLLQVYAYSWSIFHTYCHTYTTAISMWGNTRWRSWLRHCATNRNVAGSIPDGVIGIFHSLNPSSRTMAWGRLSL